METRHWLTGHLPGSPRKMLFYSDCYKCIFTMEKKTPQNVRKFSLRMELMQRKVQEMARGAKRSTTLVQDLE